MAEARDAIAEEVVRLQEWLLTWLQSDQSADWCQLSLTIAQLKALLVVADQGPLPVGGIAGSLGVTLPAASSVVDALVRRGLVGRRQDEADRRRTLVGLSPEGGELVQRLRHGVVGRLREVVRRLAHGEREALVRGLRAVVAAARAERRARLRSAVPPPIARW